MIKNVIIIPNTNLLCKDKKSRRYSTYRISPRNIVEYGEKGGNDMRSFIRENYIKILLIILLGLLFVLWARVMLSERMTNGYAGRLETNEQRIACLNFYGWEVNPTPAEQAEVILPAEFDDIYTQYNELQQVSGFDLTPYRGKKVMRYTYELTNYPIRFDHPVFANLLIYRGRLIGGDCMTTDLGGMMLPLDPRQQFRT